MNTATGTRIRLLAAILVLAALPACSQDFWDRSPRVGGYVTPSTCAPDPCAPAPCAPAATLPPPQIRDCTPCPPAACPPSTFSPSPCPPSPCPPSPCGGPTAEDREVLQLVNQIRCSRGLRPFRWSDTLYVAARDHSLEQQQCGYMGHESPDPRRRTLVQRMNLAGYDGCMFGEVVAWGYKDTRSVVEGWMNSREHRAILVDGELCEAAFARVGDYWTGNFGTPRQVAYATPPTAAYPPPTVRAPVAQAPSAPRYVPPPVAPVPAPRATRAPLRGG